MKIFPISSMRNAKRGVRNKKAASFVANSLRTSHFALRTSAAFTMIEIAICLAIIGIALVAIVGVLPLGMNVQRENREGTIINQDATVLLEAIRNGARGMNDLTNYVYAVTNNWALYKTNGNTLPETTEEMVLHGYPNPSTTIAKGYCYYIRHVHRACHHHQQRHKHCRLVEHAGIYGCESGAPINNFLVGNFYSNHIVAYVRSISGPAVEKPPQDNPIFQEDSFTYRLLCVNAPVASYTPFYLHSGWRSL